MVSADDNDERALRDNSSCRHYDFTQGETEAQKEEAGSRWVSLRRCGLRSAFGWFAIDPSKIIIML